MYLINSIKSYCYDRKERLLWLVGSIFFSFFVSLHAQVTAMWPNKYPITVAYVEVNNDNLLNVGQYVLKKSGKPFFDIAIAFANNIDYDKSQGKVVMRRNENVHRTVTNWMTNVKPLQDKGIKVLCSILGGEGGRGIANFTSRSAAHDFALQLKNYVDSFHLDGIDLDDEWVTYGQNGAPAANDSSFVIFCQELRSLMPDKLITYYAFKSSGSPSYFRANYNNHNVAEYLDYIWNAAYGSYFVPEFPEEKSGLGPGSIYFYQTDQCTAQQLAQRTSVDQYGVFVCYPVDGADRSAYLSIISQGLYGDDVALYGNLYSKTSTISTYSIVTSLNGKGVVDLPGGNTAVGTKINLYSPNNGNNQKWNIAYGSDGYYKIVSNVDNSSVLESPNANSGGSVQMNTGNGTDAQLWTVSPAGNGYYTLSPKANNGVTLDLNGASLSNGAGLTLWNKNGGRNQQFFLADQSTANQRQTYSYDPASPMKVRYPVDWNAAADSSVQFLISKYWVPSVNYFTDNDTGRINFQYWPSAHALDILVDAYQRSGNASYLTYMSNLLKGMKAANNNSFNNDFYDDMGWAGLAFLRAYEATRDLQYLSAAQAVWSEIKNGWKDDNYGGVMWSKGTPNFRNMPANGPACILAARMYAITQNQSDKDWAVKIYNWIKANVVLSSGGVIDGVTSGVASSSIYTYNQGLMIGAAEALYTITQDNAYMADAAKTADYALNTVTVTTLEGIAINNGKGDGGLFNGIYVRYLTKLARCGALPVAKRNRYVSYLKYNAENLWWIGTAKSAAHFGYYWKLAPSDREIDLTVEESGCMMIEAAALLNKENYF